VSPIRILIADDHILFRSGVASLFAAHSDFVLVGEASDGEEAATLALSLLPDITLLDVRMPVASGLDALRRIRAARPDARIVMLTASEDDNDLFDAVRLGAQGYLLKKTSPAELFAYLRGVMRGEAALSGMLAARILSEMSVPARSGPSAESLSARERDVLRLVADGASNKEIANQLHIAENTVKKHLQSILDKLHVQNRTQAAAYALREGQARRSP
jgi:two-component system NarL family response regulator